ncbi:MAG: elongation factor Ts [Clostridia bacterium]|nr:elongation factor Ts [Clostridia bacterium]
MAFTAKDVQMLREKTGVGMMECKKALTAADGDMEKAVDLLREKGLAAAAKKATRIAAEGAVYAYVDEDKKVGVVVEVNAETDFAAKSDKFQAFVKLVAEVIADKAPADVEALLALPCGTSESVAEALREQVLVIGENLSIRRFVRYEGDVVAYVHGAGRIGVLVKFDADATMAGSDVLKACGKDVAMQIAALNAPYLSQETVPAADVEKEREITVAQIQADPKNATKPEQIIQKMVDGRLNKFFKENCLLQQEFVKDSSMTVAQYVASEAKNAGGAMTLVDYVRFEKGEGLQKREDNFADEVAAMAK